MAGNWKISKKPSAANSGSPPEPPVIFLDECLGGRSIATGLRNQGLDIRIQDELDDVPRQLPDAEWAKLVAEKGWVAVTRDRRIRYRAAEKQAVADARLALFVLVSRSNLSRSEIIEVIGNAAPRMIPFMQQYEPPFIAGIHRDGRIVLWEKL